MYTTVKSMPRLLMSAKLIPVQGERFQPTGFPDIGAATYFLSDGSSRLLVESTQSMANRLEATIVKHDGTLIDELKGLSWIRVHLVGEAESWTSSLVEAHRINSPYIIESSKEFQKMLTEEMGYRRGLLIDWQKVAKTLFKYDINSLLHGIFMSNVEDGRIKLPRIISAFIEAEDIREAAYGGVKNNAMDPKGELRSANYDKDVYGNVPYSRTEYTAGAITASFNIDMNMINNLGLEEVQKDLLVNLALLKIRLFLEKGLRLRTACDLYLEEDIKGPAGIPSSAELMKSCQDLIAKCSGYFAAPSVTELECTIKIKAKKSEEE
ncbi:type I-U CRISPR-associated protein Cas7 [Myxococcota bacterium]|nr:type I-U CRISPR-associated protein Cas7 [Myxococcota bacterium]MBU1379571.1 type I-U CRISPR-associated protein Cas7 [Myxococcota bacterium]MBU1495796.1 type I-U CRISPR-associated protein Cas7 [Myxococcota bacterium]